MNEGKGHQLMASGNCFLFPQRGGSLGSTYKSIIIPVRVGVVV